MSNLVIGASGLVGYEFYRQTTELKDWNYTYHNVQIKDFIKLDALNTEELNKLFSKLSPRNVIVPAAMPDVNKCEKEPELSYTNNVGLIKNVLDSMKKYSGKKIIFFSTDYLFDGKDGPYSEDAPPVPLNVYGRHKLECEKEIISSGFDYLIIRTTGIFGWEKQRKNFMYRVIDTLTRGEELVVPNDQFANPTYIKDLVCATLFLLNHNHSGVFNVAGPEVMEREALARKIARFYKLNEKLVRGEPTSYFKSIAIRPLNSGLKINKILKLGIKMRSVEDTLKDMQEKKAEEDRYE